MCKHSECDPAEIHQHFDELNHSLLPDAKHFMLCQACMFSSVRINMPKFLERDPETSEPEQMWGQLDLTMKPWFHNHTIRRHPINFKDQWQCACLQKNDHDDNVGNHDCESSLLSKVVDRQDQRLYQGYECTECNWNMCVGCIIKHLSKKPGEKKKREKKKGTCWNKVF
jgi:hypothetical protein